MSLATTDAASVPAPPIPQHGAPVATSLADHQSEDAAASQQDLAGDAASATYTTARRAGGDIFSRPPE